jgi:DNA polymerase V
MGEQLYWHAWGVDLSPVFNDEGSAVQKGFSHGITLLKDYTNPEDVKTVILELCEEVARRSRQAKMAGRTIYLQIGYSRDEGKGGFARSQSMAKHTNVTMEIYTSALQLFNKHYTYGTVRSVYVSLSNLVPDDEVQLDLFEDVTKKKALGDVMDAIRERFGSASLLRAISYTEAGTMVERSSKIGGHRA